MSDPTRESAARRSCPDAQGRCTCTDSTGAPFAALTYGPTREDILNALTAALRRVEVRHVAGVSEADTRAAADELLAAIWPLIERRKGRGLDGGSGRP